MVRAPLEHRYGVTLVTLVCQILKAFDKYCGQMNAILESVERNKEQIIASIESSVIRHDGIKVWTCAGMHDGMCIE